MVVEEQLGLPSGWSTDWLSPPEAHVSFFSISIVFQSCEIYCLHCLQTVTKVEGKLDSCVRTFLSNSARKLLSPKLQGEPGTYCEGRGARVVGGRGRKKYPVESIIACERRRICHCFSPAERNSGKYVCVLSPCPKRCVLAKVTQYTQVSWLETVMYLRLPMGTRVRE